MADPVLPDGCGVAASFLTRCRGSRNSRQCRCGVFGLVSRHKQAEHRFPIFPLLLKRRATHARLRDQRLSHAGEGLRDQSLSHAGERLRATFQLSPWRAVGGWTWHAGGRFVVLRRQLNSNRKTTPTPILSFPSLTVRCRDTRGQVRVASQLFW